MGVFFGGLVVVVGAKKEILIRDNQVANLRMAAIKINDLRGGEK